MSKLVEYSYYPYSYCYEFEFVLVIFPTSPVLSRVCRQLLQLGLSVRYGGGQGFNDLSSIEPFIELLHPKTRLDTTFWGGLLRLAQVAARFSWILIYRRYFLSSSACGLRCRGALITHGQPHLEPLLLRAVLHYLTILSIYRCSIWHIPTVQVIEWTSCAFEPNNLRETIPPYLALCLLHEMALDYPNHYTRKMGAGH
jgi:hypothetical protein